MVEWCASVPKEGLTRSDCQFLQFLALAQLRGLSIPVWQWILLQGNQTQNDVHPPLNQKRRNHNGVAP